MRLLRVPRTLTGARLVTAADMHITLRYLGGVPDDRLAALDAVLATVRRKRFTLVAAGLDAFVRPDGVVLYVPVESVRPVMDLCTQVTDRLGGLGFDFGLRPYRPHITLARGAAGMLGGCGADFLRRGGRGLRAAWRVDEFMLYESGAPALADEGPYEGADGVDDVRGGAYRLRAVYPLRS